MSGGYVICEYEKVKASFPKFQSVMTNLRNQLIAKAEKDWNMPFAGHRKIPEAATRGIPLNAPGPGLDIDVDRGEFGETTILPALFNGLTATPLTTWHQWLTLNPGEIALGGASKVIIQGADTAGRIFEDYKVGLAGLVFLDKAIRISEIKMQISDKKLPRVNIEEALVYNKPAIVFEEGYILDEEKGFELYANITTQGPQRIKLLGLQLNRIKDKILTNTGAALV